MWNKPWNLKEGVAIVAGLLLVGLLLQFSIGPLDWVLFLWPANGITLIVLIIALILFYLLRKKVYFFRFMMTMQAAIPAIAASAGTFAPSTSRTACCRLHRAQQDVELLAIHPCLFLDDNDCRRNRSSSARTLFMAQTSRDYKSFGLVYRSNHRHTRLCRHAKTKNVLRKGTT